MRQHIVQQKDAACGIESSPHHLMLLPRVEHVKASVPCRDSNSSVLKPSLSSESKILFRCGISVRPPQFDLILHN